MRACERAYAGGAKVADGELHWRVDVFTLEFKEEELEIDGHSFSDWRALGKLRSSKLAFSILRKEQFIF